MPLNRVRLYIADFKVLVADMDWNVAALIHQFRRGLHANFQTDLVREGVTQDLEVSSKCYILIDWHSEEL